MIFQNNNYTQYRNDLLGEFSTFQIAIERELIRQPKSLKKNINKKILENPDASRYGSRAQQLLDDGWRMLAGRLIKEVDETLKNNSTNPDDYTLYSIRG